MVARVTLAEVDAVRTRVSDAIGRFEATVVPELERQDGYEGCYVLTTPHGKALVMTFWRDGEAAEASLENGLYAAQVQKFVTVMRSSPGRETYDVSVADAPVLSGI
jgi:heme-degrading monooxygenase HmoA